MFELANVTWSAVSRPGSGLEVHVSSASSADETPPTADVAVAAMGFDRLACAGGLLASSYAEYPAWRYVFPDSRQRKRALSVFFAATVRDAIAFGAVDAAIGDDRVLGIAVWLPPGRYPWSVSRKLRATPAMLGVLRAAPGRFGMFARLGANTERLHPRYPHWHLEMVGIRPEAQGRGIGSRLMAPGLARADQGGLPCYLTTAKRENVAFYERFGFEVADDALPLLPGGPTQWGMRRPARSAA
jgi:ribosomal protein S18 acetylase RimI-like enzyme